uniref:Catsper channel auxiliary subunit zeta n=1 Tax=Bos taurus TaxID=9913 RepID=A0ABI0NXN4_BOVIN
MEGKPLKVRTLPGPPHPASSQAHPGPLTVLSFSPGSGQLPTITPHAPHLPPPPAGECQPWLGSGSLVPACSPSPPDSPRPSASLVVCGPQASAKSSSHHGSGRSSLQDIRNMWTTATLSQPKLNVQLPTVREDSELEDVSVSEKPSSVSSLNISRHTPHRAYWVEQQSRLPLPLTELMENEALEILTEALRSYQSEIGRDHSLTKQLQRYIEGLKRRRNRRLQVLAV